MLEIQQCAAYLAVRTRPCQDSAFPAPEGVFNPPPTGDEPICFPANLFRRGEVEGDVLDGSHAGLQALYPPTAARKSDGVWLVCFLKASLNVDFDAKPESIANASIFSCFASPALMRRCTSRTRYPFTKS